jgi:uridine phosphorylase
LTAPATIHLRPHEDVAERVLLPGDPGRALRLAQLLIDGPKMLNHNRGLWGYTGPALADGDPLTIQSTGMGGPSAAIVIEELIDLGARRIVRVGTCGALVDGLGLGELVVAEGALAADGTSQALGAVGVVAPDPWLLDALEGRRGVIVSSDLFYDPDPLRAAGWVAEGAIAVEMEAAALFAVAARRGVAAGCVVVVSDIVASRERISSEGLEAAEAVMGRVAVAGLAARTSAG